MTSLRTTTTLFAALLTTAGLAALAGPASAHHDCGPHDVGEDLAYAWLGGSSCYGAGVDPDLPPGCLGGLHPTILVVKLYVGCGASVAYDPSSHDCGAPETVSPTPTTHVGAWLGEDGCFGARFSSENVVCFLPVVRQHVEPALVEAGVCWTSVLLHP